MNEIIRPMEIGVWPQPPYLIFLLENVFSDVIIDIATKFMKHRMLVNHDQSVCIVYTLSQLVAKNILQQFLCPLLFLSSPKNYVFHLPLNLGKY